MASKDAPTSPDGASGAGQLVPEVNTADQISMDPVAGVLLQLQLLDKLI